MDANQEQGPAYGESFRKGVTYLVDELGKFEFVTPQIKEKVTLGAAKLCLTEAVVEQRAAEIAKQARKEWDEKYSKQVQAATEHLVGFINAFTKTK
jgi:hypothetical protein